MQDAYGTAHAANCRSSLCPTCHIGLVRVSENHAADFSRANPHDRDVLFEDATTRCLSDDNRLRLNRMWKPVNWEYVRFTADGRAYFLDPDYPDWIQVVENRVWVSKLVSSVKQYVFYHTSHLTEIGLILDRGIMGEDMKKIVKEAEMSLPKTKARPRHLGPLSVPLCRLSRPTMRRLCQSPCVARLSGSAGRHRDDCFLHPTQAHQYPHEIIPTVRLPGDRHS